LVNGICDSVPDFVAVNVALILERFSRVASKVARSGSMARLQEPGIHENRFVARWNPHHTTHNVPNVE
jgi:hypothetical protein